MKKNLDITKAANSEQVLPFPCIFGLSALYLGSSVTILRVRNSESYRSGL